MSSYTASATINGTEWGATKPSDALPRSVKLLEPGGFSERGDLPVYCSSNLALSGSPFNDIPALEVAYMGTTS